MASINETKQPLSLKLLVSQESNKVIFAEAKKDFVDILCSFLTLPLGTIARLVEKDSNMGPVTVGSLNSLYHSVENLYKENLMMETCKELLLRPKNLSEDYCSTLELNIDDTVPAKYFTCSKLEKCNSPGVSISPINSCPSCNKPLTRYFFLKHFSWAKGFVSSAATFLITDELIVMPNTMDNINLDMIQYFAIKGTSSVIEVTVDVTNEKVLDLLKCALLSKSPLTDLFIGQKPYLEKSRFSSCDFENTANIKIKINLKLFVRKTDFKILFALGNEDFANLILSFLTFPLGGVLSKLGKKCSFGSIDGLHKSIADLDVDRYFLSRDAGSRLFGLSLDPQPQSRFCTQLLSFQKPDLRFYCHFRRENYRDSVIHNKFFINHKKMSTDCKEWYCIDSKSSIPEAFVGGPRTYVVSDDLVIAPASPISALDFINHFGTPLKDIQEKVVTIGFKEGLSILKASLNSTCALTNGLCHLLTEENEDE